MWNQLSRYLPEFSSAVLTSVDPAGFPFSLRCQPRLNPARQVLLIDLPVSAPLQPGPAGLLCHTHNDHLWNLKSFVVRGALERDGAAWLLRPAQFIPGMGIGGWRSYVHFVRHGRQATRAYFAKRGLPQPHVDLDAMLALLTGG
jgi:hypothetical protein